MISYNSNEHKSSASSTVIMELSLNVKWRNDKPNGRLLVVNTTSTAGNCQNEDIHTRSSSELPKSTPFYGEISTSIFPIPPPDATYRWIKNGKQEDWQESWLLWQPVNEMPKLLKLIVRAGIRYTASSYLSWMLSFVRNSVPCLRLTAASWERRRRRAAPQWHGHLGREEPADLVSGDKRVVKKSYLYPVNLLNISAQF